MNFYRSCHNTQIKDCHTPRVNVKKTGLPVGAKYRVTDGLKLRNYSLSNPFT